ncbi:MAG: hypothetical protein KKB51_08400 [Candidatus Riflebacteria bacterium]|nr:hypothetical protein [Candidatus Riflebacteria bacterium]
MAERERVVNQTLLIWSAIVVVEIFVIAHLMAFPVLILAAMTMFWPIKAALNWPKPLDKSTDSSAPAATAVER